MFTIKISDYLQSLDESGDIGGVLDGYVEQVRELEAKANLTTVFELIENTSDEVYHPIGIYLSREKAEAEITLANARNMAVYKEGEYAGGDYEIIKILERSFGQSGNGEQVYECKRIYEYADDPGDLLWKMVSETRTVEENIKHKELFIRCSECRHWDSAATHNFYREKGSDFGRCNSGGFVSSAATDKIKNDSLVYEDTAGIILHGGFDTGKNFGCVHGKRQDKTTSLK